tara:strand:- start:855 stop:1400 length:546 start_codon:yes stop_codon:yes gene_type:complete
MQKFPYAKKHINPYEFDKIMSRWEKTLESFDLASYVSPTFLWSSCEEEHFTRFDYYEFTFIANLLDAAFLLCSHMEAVTKITYSNKTVAKIFQALFTERCKHWIPFCFLQAKNRLFLQSNILSLPQLRHRFGKFQSIFANPTMIAVGVFSDDFFEDFVMYSLGATYDYGSTNAEDSSLCHA